MTEDQSLHRFGEVALAGKEERGETLLVGGVYRRFGSLRLVAVFLAVVEEEVDQLRVVFGSYADCYGKITDMVWP